jgi:alkyl sulfatase BDS1-like metallo-beta-lactamase superfamily hydrolase
MQEPKAFAKPDATLTLTRATMSKIQLGETTLDKAVASGDAKIDGQKDAFSDLLGMLDNYKFWFNIVTP